MVNIPRGGGSNLRDGGDGELSERERRTRMSKNADFKNLGR